MRKKKIVGIFGQLGNGKDEVANHLVKQFNESCLYLCDGWRRIGFADAVKKVFMTFFDATWEFIEEWKRKPEIPPDFDLTVRQALQHIGDGFRKIQSDVWIRTALRNDHNMVISDGRYINEAKMIREKGGLNILLWRPGFENTDPNPSESQIKPYVDYCVSEVQEGKIPLNEDVNAELHGMQYFDYFLANNGTKEDLYKKLDNEVIPFINGKLAAGEEICLPK